MRGKDPLRESVAYAAGTTLVFSVLVVATVVQVLFGGQGSLQGVQAALWVLIVVAAGVRQEQRSSPRTTTPCAAASSAGSRTRPPTCAGLGPAERGPGGPPWATAFYGVDHRGPGHPSNPSAMAMLGYEADDLQGRRAHEVFHAPDPDGSPFPWSRCYIYEAITHGLVASAEEEDDYLRADGTSLPRRDHRRAPARRGRGPRRGRGLP